MKSLFDIFPHSHSITHLPVLPSHGGAVIVTGTNPSLYMNNVRAIGNRALSTSSNGGGFLYIDTNTSATVVNSYFENNIAYRGGSFFVSASSTLNITNTVFRNGSTYNSRGGDVHNNGGQFFWTGGASYGSYQNIDYSISNQNLALQGASGGSVSLLGGSASISGIHFEGQRVAYFGALF